MILYDLDNWNTRNIMKDIILKDDNLYYSDSRFYLDKNWYINLLIKNIENWNINSFIDDLMLYKKINDNKWNKVPTDAHIVLWTTEFNRYYILALINQIKNNNLSLMVYRFRDVENPRNESENLIWKIYQYNDLIILEKQLLSTEEKIRFNPDIWKPNSWITFKLLKWKQ